jgi:uncharacterized protein (DUF1810 family)
MDDKFNLDRFVRAQSQVLPEVLDELDAGRKTSHWMWYIFPQIKGLGHSSTSQYFAISSLDEAEAYLQHSVLGPRLIACTALVLSHKDRSIEQIFGTVDALKFKSSMSLFAVVDKDNPVFEQALEKAGGVDVSTMRILRHNLIEAHKDVMSHWRVI